ncbi:hypothetical protein M758_1G127600 [Ceratodon purpureus]|nr:hypothetical protein M758_1G127600 [Ceratodon purpureus]
MSQQLKMAWPASLYPLLVVVALLALNPTPTYGQSPSQANFISIDCGASKPYTDPVTGINWVTDANYTSVGTNVDSVPLAVAYSNNSEYSTLRYFNEPRKKYCYTLPVTSNTTYLLATTFYYGNYDKLNKRPIFQMAIDATEMLQIDLTDPSYATSPMRREYLGRTAVGASTLSVCFYQDPAALQTPFVSSIELRLLDYRTYEATWLTAGNFLFAFSRQDFGGDRVLRYPDDAFDRVWNPWTVSGLVKVSAPSPVIDTLGTYIMPPPLVMQTALTPATLGPLVLPYKYGSATLPIDCAIFLYFTDVSLTSTATSRIFSVTVPGPFANEPYTINIYNYTGGANKPAVFFWNNMTVSDTSVITMTPTPTSIDPPLVSAAELFAKFPALVQTTDIADAAVIESIKVALKLTGWGGDPCLPVPLDWIGCSTAKPPRVISVKLANYSLTGQIPADFGKLTALTSLHLENNELSGSIPDSLATLPALTELILYNNNLTGVVPTGLASKPGLVFDIRGNPVCNCTRVDPIGPASSPIKSNVGIIAGVVGGVLGVLLVVALVVIFCVCRKRSKAKRDKLTELPTNQFSHGSTGTNGAGGSVDKNSQGAKPYSLAEITAATENFKKKIGEGGFGPVYYGKFPNGREVAVKVSDANSRQGVNEFNNEVQLLSRVHHKNLVSLVGYCQDGKTQMLVYEFLHRGTVREHLYGSPLALQEPLDWKTRLDVALNAAQGLEYLHSGCTPSIIHRDIKSSNILLTNKNVAKVADFGLSRLGPEEGGASHVSTMVKGTAGYLDPEYWSTNNLTEKSDVFSFGVVLLELLCGRQPIDNTLEDRSQWNINDKVRRSLQAGDMDSILDPAIKNAHPNMDSVWKVAEIAIQSVEPKGVHRPYMRDVVKELREAIQLELGHSGAYTSDYSNNSGTQFQGRRPSNLQTSAPDHSNASLDSMNFSETYQQGPHVR